MPVTESHIAMITDTSPAIQQGNNLATAQPEFTSSSPDLADPVPTPSVDGSVMAELNRLLEVIAGQINEIMALMDDVPFDERGEYIEQLSLLMSAGQDVTVAIRQPTSANISRVLQNANKALVNDGHDDVNDMPGERSEASDDMEVAAQAENTSSVAIEEIKAARELQQSLESTALPDPLLAPVDHVDTLPEPMQDYFAPGVAALTALLQNEHVRDMLLSHPDKDLALLETAFRALTTEQKEALAAQFGDQPITMDALKAELAYAYEDGLLSADMVINAFVNLQQVNQQPSPEGVAQDVILMDKTILALEALHLNLVAGRELMASLKEVPHITESVATDIVTSSPIPETEPDKTGEIQAKAVPANRISSFSREGMVALPPPELALATGQSGS